MKKKLLLAFALLVCLSIAFWPETSVHGNSSGAPVGYTGSTFENNGRTCGTGSGCHGGGSTVNNSWITTNIPACGYTPGQTYSISVFVTSPGRTKFGFSLSPQFNSGASAGTTAGTLIATNGTQLQSSGRYITHTSAGNQQNGTNSRTWTFSWTAPASGSVTFFAAMNASNSQSNSSGDIIFNGSIVVNPNTTPALTISNSGNNVFCASNPVTLTSSISGNNVWTLNGISAGTGNTLVASAGGTYEVTNTSGTCVQTQSVTLAAISGPPVLSPVNVGPEGLEICEGETTTLSTSGSNLVWQPGNQSGNSITVSQAGSYTVSSTNECGTSTSDPLTVVVNALPATPEITVTADDGFCEGNTVILSANNAGSGDQIGWSPGNSSATSINVSESGTYTVVFSNGCGESELVSQEITFDPIPETPVISLNGEGFLETTTTADVFAWFLDGVEIEGQTGPTLQPQGLGVYEVQAINGQNCLSAISEGFNYDPTSNGSLINSAVRIYPQPAHDMLTVVLPMDYPNDNLMLVDLQGRVLRNFPVNGGNIVNLPIDLPAGMYIMKTKYFCKPVVIQ